MNKYARHESHGNREEHKRHHSDDAANARAQTAAAGDEAREEGADLEEKRKKEEDPAEAPHVVVVVRGGVAAVLANERARGTHSVGGPDLTKGHGRVGAAALLVVRATGIQVRPLGDVVGAGYAGRVGL